MGTMGNVAAAKAAEVQEAMIRGSVSYSRFLEAIDAGQIQAINIDPMGKNAFYRTLEGGTGSVALFNDPKLLEILNKANVDINVIAEKAQ